MASQIRYLKIYEGPKCDERKMQEEAIEDLKYSGCSVEDADFTWSTTKFGSKLVVRIGAIGGR